MRDHRYRSILLTYADLADEPALELAAGLAQEARGYLDVVVPIPPPSRFAYLTYASASHLRHSIEQQATRTARCLAARIPDGVALTTRCLPVRGVPELMRAIDAGAYDLCVARGSRWPGFYATRVGLATVRRARRAGLPTFVVRDGGRAPLATVGSTSAPDARPAAYLTE
ncbi:hypothetical protein DSM104299_04060 [Baekduia alba]|uniref:hypothetical protein n=1 Tax=Baekduia alba TaxID=2997333 RepID=UPI002340B4BF|nr:hypothetical protein [Baekduia alba]WCB95317.1 hypothetical protein DSM104299_04060 [Baekduia alba]